MRPLVPRLAAGLTATALVAAGLATVLGAVATTTAPAAGAAARPAYTVTTLHFLVHTGADGAQACDVVGDLYLPRDAGPRHRVPAILTTNGFGGSKDDQAGIGKAFARRGYAVLSYSGLGFGGSGCKITLDDPDTDGKAASQLVSYLGGRAGIAFTDAGHTQAAPRLRAVELDHPGDPRLGMIGGSYGGEIQFAAASVDRRIDTIVPLITWNDLSYSLAPDNADLTSGVTSATPGAVKLVWGAAFSALGVADGAQGAQQDPSRMVGCPNFATFVCPALATGATTGYFQDDTIASLRHASVESYMTRIKIPVLLVQGEKDTLFNLNEAAATYRALRRQGTPVTMIWQSWGHSDLTPAPGEVDLSAPDPVTQYETGRIMDWFDHYLRGKAVSTGPRFAYFRDWVRYRGNAAPAYAASPGFPVGREQLWRLSGSGDLKRGQRVTPGSQSLVTPPAGAPTTFDDLDVIGSYFNGSYALSGQSAPGTTATWRTPALKRPMQVVGIPRARFSVETTLGGITQTAGPAGELVLFLKLVDIAPDGTAHSIDGEIAPVRIAQADAPVRVALPAIVHRFAKGHALGLVVAGGSADYRGNLAPADVKIYSCATNTLTIPVVR